MSVCVLVANIKKLLPIQASLYTILHVLSIATFEETPIFNELSEHESEIAKDVSEKQLWLLQEKFCISGNE